MLEPKGLQDSLIQWFSTCLSIRMYTEAFRSPQDLLREELWGWDSSGFAKRWDLFPRSHFATSKAGTRVQASCLASQGPFTTWSYSTDHKTRLSHLQKCPPVYLTHTYSHFSRSGKAQNKLPCLWGFPGWKWWKYVWFTYVTGLGSDIFSYICPG